MTAHAELFSREFFQDPFPTYRWLRENSPVHRFTLPLSDVPVYIVTRYHDVKTVLTDPRIGVNVNLAAKEFQESGMALGRGTEMDHSVALVDPPDHTRLRKLIMKAFTPARVRQWRTLVEDETNRALGKLEGRSEFDLLADFATPTPARVIGHILGIPEDDQDFLLEHTVLFTSADPEMMAEVPKSAQALFGYVRELVKAKQESPADDLVSHLVQLNDSGDRLTYSELVAVVLNMIGAGFDTPALFTANSVLALLQQPEALAHVLDPRSDIDAAVEELLRAEGPALHGVWRFPREALTIAGVDIPAGAAIMPAFASANRDHKVFTDPDLLNFARGEERHLALGHGYHNCIGAALARLEASVMIPAIVRRFPTIRLAVEPTELVYRMSLVGRSLTALPVTVG